MNTRRLSGTLAAALVLGGIGCSPTPPATAPSPAPPVSNNLVIYAVSPLAGRPAAHTAVRLLGTGFQSGAVLTFDGNATPATVESGRVIRTTAPPHPAGAIDVVVTNPDGRTSRLDKAFTYIDDVQASGDLTIDVGGSATSTLDPFERTCSGEGIACRLLFIRAPADHVIEVELMSLDLREHIGLYDEIQGFMVDAPTLFPKQLTAMGGQKVWVMGERALFKVTARLAK